MRIDDSTWHASILRHLRDGSERLFRLQQEAASGERLRLPSEDAVGYQRKLDRTADLEALNGLQSVVQTEIERLDACDGLLGDLTDTVRQARNLAQRGTNATADNQTRLALAGEVDRLIQATLRRANTDEHGRYLLGGSRSSSPPFQPDSPAGRIESVSYQGDRCNPSTLLPLTLHGEAVMAGSGQDMFAVLIGLRNGLESGNLDPALALDQLAQVEQNLLDRRGEVGSAVRYLEELKQGTQDRQLRAQDSLARVAGVDLAETVTNLVQAENRQKASLEVAARQGRLSLVDYLR